MTKHEIRCLIGLGVPTAYYQEDGHKAVVEVNTQGDGTTLADVYIDGRHEGGGKVSDVLNRNGIALDKWTLKPGQS